MSRHWESKKSFGLATTVLDLSSATSQTSIDYQATPALHGEEYDDRTMVVEEQAELHEQHDANSEDELDFQPYEHETTFVAQDEEEVEYTEAQPHTVLDAPRAYNWSLPTEMKKRETKLAGIAKWREDMERKNRAPVLLRDSLVDERDNSQVPRALPYFMDAGPSDESGNTTLNDSFNQDDDASTDDEATQVVDVPRRSRLQRLDLVSQEEEMEDESTQKYSYASLQFSVSDQESSDGEDEDDPRKLAKSTKERVAKPLKSPKITNFAKTGIDPFQQFQREQRKEKGTRLNDSSLSKSRKDHLINNTNSAARASNNNRGAIPIANALVITEKPPQPISTTKRKRANENIPPPMEVTRPFRSQTNFAHSPFMHNLPSQQPSSSLTNRWDNSAFLKSKKQPESPPWRINVEVQNADKTKVMILIDKSKTVEDLKQEIKAKTSITLEKLTNDRGFDLDATYRLDQVLNHGDVIVRGVPRRFKRLHEIYDEVCAAGNDADVRRSALIAEQLQFLSLGASNPALQNPNHNQAQQPPGQLPAQSSSDDGLVLTNLLIRDLRSLSALVARDDARQQFPAKWFFINLRFEEQFLSQESQPVETDNEQAILAAAFDSLRQIRIESLALCKLNLQPPTLQSILFKIERFSSLTHLNLSNTSLEHVIEALPNVLFSQSRLVSLNLSACDLSYGVLQRFWQGVQGLMKTGNQNMRDVNLSSNKISLAGFSVVLKLMQRLFPCLRSLDLSRNQLICEEQYNASSVEILKRELADLAKNKYKNFMLDELILERNKPLDSSALGMVDFTRIKALSLLGCKLEHSSIVNNNGGSELGKSSESSESTLQLFLRQKSFSALSRLSLAQNNLSKEIHSLVAALSRMPCINELDLSTCSLGMTGVIGVIEASKSSFSLRSLTLKSNVQKKPEEEEIDNLRKAISETRIYLLKLDLGANSFVMEATGENQPESKNSPPKRNDFRKIGDAWKNKKTTNLQNVMSDPAKKILLLTARNPNSPDRENAHSS